MVSTEFLITSLILVLIPGTGVIYTSNKGFFREYEPRLRRPFGCNFRHCAFHVSKHFWLSLNS